uniref:Uncharacterized protein n=1 Tax=Oryza glumipatula TaxID=40148 RepID=A0A0D9ZZ59_9ORYZ
METTTATAVDRDGGGGEWQGGDGKAAETARIHAAQRRLNPAGTADPPPESMPRRPNPRRVGGDGGNGGRLPPDPDTGPHFCSRNPPQQPRHGPLLAGGGGPAPAAKELHRTILEMQAAHGSQCSRRCTAPASAAAS